MHHMPPGVPACNTCPQVCLHELGSSGGRGWRASHADLLLHEEPNPAAFLDLSRSKDWQLLAINSNTKTSSEVGG